jgi:hypothetical protein
LGGWLRGTEALSVVVGKSFSKDGAELLHQPVLADHFQVRLEALPEKERKAEVITKILAGLQKIRPLMGAEDGSKIGEKDVKKIGDICADLVSAVNSKAQ